MTTSAENLAGQMAQQQTAYIHWIGQMEKIMLYDYGKLSAVGNAVGDDPAWTWQPTTTSQAITASSRTTASAYSALTPVQWSGYNLTPDGVTQTSSNDVTTLACDDGLEASRHHGLSVRRRDCPTPPAATRNQFHAATTIDGSGLAVDEVRTFANLNSNTWSAQDTAGVHAEHVADHGHLREGLDEHQRRGLPNTGPIGGATPITRRAERSASSSSSRPSTRPRTSVSRCHEAVLVLVLTAVFANPASAGAAARCALRPRRQPRATSSRTSTPTR